MIPKTIHYCWFGYNPKPKKIKQCIKSWKKYCPDFKIIEWNERNYDISSAPQYVKQAYQAKKWAFVTDYVRLDLLFQYGGIYMDTDVELVKPLNDFLEYNCFLGFQHEKYVATGLVAGAKAHHPFIEANRDVYQDLSFFNDSNSHQLTVCQEYTTSLLQERGLIVPCDGKIQIVDDIYVFPPEYFCPYDHRSLQLNKTENTVAIHHFASSWWDEERKRDYKRLKKRIQNDYIIHTPNRFLRHLLGRDRYQKLKNIIKRRKNVNMKRK